MVNKYRYKEVKPNQTWRLSTILTQLRGLKECGEEEEAKEAEGGRGTRGRSSLHITRYESSGSYFFQS